MLEVTTGDLRQDWRQYHEGFGLDDEGDLIAIQGYSFDGDVRGIPLDADDVLVLLEDARKAIPALCDSVDALTTEVERLRGIAKAAERVVRAFNMCGMWDTCEGCKNALRGLANGMAEALPVPHESGQCPDCGAYLAAEPCNMECPRVAEVPHA